MPTPEGKIKAKLNRRLNELFRLYRFWPVQMGLGASTLDCLLCAGGWIIAIETKRAAKAKLTPRQEYVKQQIEEAHGLVFVVYDAATLDHAIEVIRSCCMLADEIRTEIRT